MKQKQKKHGKRPGRNLRPSRARYWSHCTLGIHKIRRLMKHRGLGDPVAARDYWLSVRKRYFGEEPRIAQIEHLGRKGP